MLFGDGISDRVGGDVVGCCHLGGVWVDHCGEVRIMPVVVFDVANKVVVVPTGMVELLREPLPCDSSFASVFPEGHAGHGRLGVAFQAAHFRGSAKIS